MTPVLFAARERVIGWYHTGPRLRESDLDIHGLLGNYCSNPLLLICEVQPKEVGLPVHAYVAEDEVSKDGTQRATKVFVNLPTVVGSTEAEQIGVEHLLRDVKDATVGTLSSEIGDVVHGLRGLKSRLLEIQDYLGKVVDGTLPLNHDILRNLQDIFTLLPDLDVEGLATSFSCEVNDWMAVTYLASLLRAIIALHTLVENKEARLAKETHRAKVEGAKEAEEAKADKAEASSVLKTDGGASDGTSD
ncbi:maintenance of mitochondrial structure and function protein [Helicosporidium sp. ATCC 50920]|nr:maintenance of mitochondrial structure and function protein [Helicosporidium sp. ATCC 50920]|eukprot:KDD73949.1 maintenance of mitochondrial structure and function protein [Helicosporidium sp. ATCC 50920]